ncbi:MAG: dihydroxyacetone kinase subunit DhaL [Chloroflexota bacterium]|jgi:phosphoenolpyruvate---glycerone phosphotransferase subunit DhaL
MAVTKEQIVSWLEQLNEVFVENKEYLTELDSAIGDADHGNNMARGFRKVLEKLPSVADRDIGNIFKTTGMTLISSVGGASGPLYGTFFMRGGMAASAKEELNGQDLYQVLQSGVEGIIQRGRAQVGDKTMIDAWTPAMAALKTAVDNGDDIVSALRQAVAAAEQGMNDTIPLQAKKGRASYLGERSKGHQDPGATSTFLMLKALLQIIEQ